MTSPIHLRQDTLSQLPNSVGRPTYDREALTAGIMHIGVGGFHRSHQAWYTDQLLSDDQDSSQNWAICGVGLREADREMAEVLKKQDYLYTLIIRHPDGKVDHQVIGSLIDFMLSIDDPQAVIDRMADEQTKIVSLTITEGGYNFDPTTGEFDFSQTDVKHDLENPNMPRTVFGYLTQALRQRRDAGVSAFTIQSCDNIEHNGDVARKMLLAFARELDSKLAKWIEDNACFPNAMVDRITPVTTDADRENLKTKIGIVDQWPVTCEPFCQWVIEDRFAQDRPKWETVGAQFVDNVTPYETMKLRLLNAGHSVLGLLGSLHGHETIDSCIADPLFAHFVRSFMDTEATPVLKPVEGVDLEDYKDALIERFGNPSIKDDLSRICLESSAKLPKFLIPTIHENLQQDGSVERSALVIAAWCFYSDKGESQQGDKLKIVDALRDELHKAAKETSNDKLAFLRLTSLFGDLAEQETFTAAYTRFVDAIYSNTPVAELMEAIVDNA